MFLFVMKLIVFHFIFYNLPIFHTLWSSLEHGIIQLGTRKCHFHFIFVLFIVEFFTTEKFFCIIDAHLSLAFFILIFGVAKKIPFNLFVNILLIMRKQKLRRDKIWDIWKRFNENAARQNKEAFTDTMEILTELKCELSTTKKKVPFIFLRQRNCRLIFIG